MITLIVLFIVLAALFLLTAHMVHKSWRTRKLSLVAIVGMIIALTGLVVIGYITFMLVHTFVYVPQQGKIVGVLPDASWIRDNRDVLYIKGHRLYSIGLDGQRNRQLYDGDVRYYALSPDKTKIAIYYLNSKQNEDDRNIGNISIVNLADGTTDQIEQKVDSKNPSWLPDGSKIYYEYGDDHHIIIYDVVSKTKSTIDEPQRVADVVAAKADRKLFYSSLFDKKCHEVDVDTLAQSEITPYKKSKSSILSDCVRESDIYMGISSGNDIRDWKVESPSKSKIAYNKEGSLWLKTESGDQKLVTYVGIYDSKFAPGIGPISWSEDERYLASDFKGKIYITDTNSKKTGYLIEGDSARILESSL